MAGHVISGPGTGGRDRVRVEDAGSALFLYLQAEPSLKHRVKLPQVADIIFTVWSSGQFQPYYGI